MSMKLDVFEFLSSFQFSTQIVRLEDLSLPQNLPDVLKEKLLQPSTKQIRCWEQSAAMRKYSAIVSPLIVSPRSAQSKKFVVFSNLETFSLMRSYLPPTAEISVLCSKRRLQPEQLTVLIQMDILRSKLTLGSVPESGFKSLLNSILLNDDIQKLYTHPLFQNLFPNISSRKDLAHLFDIANRKVC